MPDIKDRQQFEPNHDARKVWLGTRKGKKVGNISGFYSTEGYHSDTSWVIVAICIELIAVGLTIYGGFNKGGVWLIVAIIAICAFVILDFIGANLYHKPEAGRNLARANNELANAANEVQAAGGFQLQMQEGKGYKFFGGFFIILSSFIKIASILLLGNFNIIIYLVIAMFYFLVVYIHIKHTGYFWAEWSATRMFERQHDLWASGDKTFNARQFISVFKTNEHIIDINQNGHSITKVKNDDNSYQLQTNGILLDDDISQLLNGQPRTAISIICSECRLHQINFIHP